jgi:uncharacterized hydrophobic protein (TIGR00271 family)
VSSVTPDPSRETAPSSRDERARPGSWPRVWIAAVRGLTQVSAERREAVLRETYEGSQPTAIYYVLLGLSELIAGFALLINSDATLIGANVVAPLMTPIFGVSLSLMRGDLRLLRSALLAEFGGAALGVALCFGLGLLPFAFDPSPALLAQTKPTLIDLMVAALAGFAGGLAMIDERVSPALPGVAIATALNPPIAAIGLCLAYGAYDGAWGAFILFFANVLAILAVAAVLFLVAGFVTRKEFGSVGILARRFAPAVVGLVVVTVLLTSYLFGMVENLRTTRAIDEVLRTQLSREPGTALVGTEIVRRNEELEVLATARTPRIVSPERVAQMQEELTKKLGVPVRLYVRCGVVRDVVASGTKELRPWVSLEDRDSRETEADPKTLLLQEAEQVAREVATSRPEFVLKDVELLTLASGPVVIFSIENARDPSPTLVASFERILRERLGRSDVRVVARTVDSRDITSKGRILFGEAHFLEQSAEDDAEQKKVEDAVRASLEAVPNTFVTAVDAIRRSGGWVVRAEASAPRALLPEEVKAAEQRSSASTGSAVTISVRTKSDLTVTSSGYEALGGNRAAEPSP